MFRVLWVHSLERAWYVLYGTRSIETLGAKLNLSSFISLKKNYWANCKTALVLRSNSMFAPLFLTLHVCPSFLNPKAPVAPDLWSGLNGVKYRLKRQKCPLHEWSKNQSEIFYIDLLCTYVGQMTAYILYKYQSTYCACKHNLCR
jgi:hypothetical protein